MRVIVTKLMDNGLPRPTRGMPHDGLMLSHRDKDGRLTYQLYYPYDGGDKPIVGCHLISPQCGDVTKRTAVYFGFERAGGGARAPLVAQAWEVEPAHR